LPKTDIAPNPNTPGSVNKLMLLLSAYATKKDRVSAGGFVINIFDRTNQDYVAKLEKNDFLHTDVESKLDEVNNSLDDVFNIMNDLWYALNRGYSPSYSQLLNLLSKRKRSNIKSASRLLDFDSYISSIHNVESEFIYRFIESRANLKNMSDQAIYDCTYIAKKSLTHSIDELNEVKKLISVYDNIYNSSFKRKKSEFVFGNHLETAMSILKSSYSVLNTVESNLDTSKLNDSEIKPLSSLDDLWKQSPNGVL